MLKSVVKPDYNNNNNNNVSQDKYKLIVKNLNLLLEIVVGFYDTF